ncbi:MAG: hypothetical protein JSS83_25350 [Cyanobacteria bacterium SZAS LIN-3]|nr:hypothetical protein [Cyanobacteria bacterium SZAS LIN-3]
MPKSLSIAAVVILAMVPISPCLAQEYIVGPLPTVESSTTTVIKSTSPSPSPGSSSSSSSSEVLEIDQKGVQFKFKERLSNIQDQIDTGREKGWISAGQAAAFSSERERLLGVTNRVESDGWPKPDVNNLEKDVTAFSATVTTAMSKASVPTSTTTTIETK